MNEISFIQKWLVKISVKTWTVSGTSHWDAREPPFTLSSTKFLPQRSGRVYLTWLLLLPGTKSLVPLQWVPEFPQNHVRFAGTIRLVHLRSLQTHQLQRVSSPPLFSLRHRDMSQCSHDGNLLLWMCPRAGGLFSLLCTWRLGHSHVMQGSLVRSYEMFKCCLADGQVLFPMKRKQWLDYAGYSLVPLFSAGYRVDSRREDMVADHCSFLAKSPAHWKRRLLSFKQCEHLLPENYCDPVAPCSRCSLLPVHWSEVIVSE